MTWIAIILGVLFLAACGVAGWLWVRLGQAQREGQDIAQREADARSREGVALAQAETLRGEVQQLQVRATQLQGQVDKLHALAEQDAQHTREREETLRREFAQREQFLDERFAMLAKDVLKDSKTDFLQLAREHLAKLHADGISGVDQRNASIKALLEPMDALLKQTQAKLESVDQSRATTEARLAEQLKVLRETSTLVSQETRRLADALRRPEARGRYGELQLRRVAELAGMTEYCDFTTQTSLAADEDGSRRRPDMIVHMPSGRRVVVDAKANIQAYIDAEHAPSREQREALLDKFAEHVAKQVGELSGKRYWEGVEGSADFVVMFVPGDQFLAEALARRPDLLELAAGQQVVLATPATLIALLRAVAIGYREEKLAKEAQELRTLGMLFHERAATALGYIDDLGRHLGNAASSYNKFVGSYQDRLHPTLEKFEQAGVKSKKDTPALGEVKVSPRTLDRAMLPAGEGATPPRSAGLMLTPGAGAGPGAGIAPEPQETTPPVRAG